MSTVALSSSCEAAMANLCWSVKNQARMHVRNGDTLYAVGSRRHAALARDGNCGRGPASGHSGSIEVSAPHGLDDLFALRLCPTPYFLTDKLPDFYGSGFRQSAGLDRYPKLSLETEAIGQF